MKIGQPGVKTNFVQKKYFAIKKGTQVFRILPPMGDLAERGIWNVYYATHFGYRTSDNKMKVFQSPEVYNRKTKMVDVADEAKERIKRLVAQKTILTKRMEEAPSPAIEAQLSKISAELENYNLEKRFYVNAMDSNGQIGLLKLKTREKAALEAARKKIEAEEGFDPVGVEGVFLTFDKTGDGAQDSVVSVTMNMRSEVIGGRTVKVPNTHTVTEELYPRLEKEAFDLGKLFIKPTPEEVAAMVRDGAPAVDVVAAKYKTPYQNATPKATVSTLTSSASNKNVEIEPPEVDMEDEIDSMAQMAGNSSVTPAPSDVAGMSDEEFLRANGMID